MQLSKTLKSQIYQHAKNEYPKECCGLIINGNYYPCDNVATDPHNHFEISPTDFIAFSEIGEIQAIVHSHPDGSAEPSEVDKIQMGLHGVDWVIVGIGKDLLINDFYVDLKLHKFTTHYAPLLGREYVHGLQDCYTFVQDYYQRELNIVLPNFERQIDWWEDETAEPLYQQNFEKVGFQRLENFNELQPHDVILCRIGRTYHINHALIFLGDYQLKSENVPPTVGNNLIIHHPHRALSRREIFGESWQKRVAMIVRYKDFL